jgi:hypothetical protein
MEPKTRYNPLFSQDHQQQITSMRLSPDDDRHKQVHQEYLYLTLILISTSL